MPFSALQQRIGVVTQEAHLFHDTLRANLSYARPEASDAQIRDALRDAQILDVVEGLSEGLDTVLHQKARWPTRGPPSPPPAWRPRAAAATWSRPSTATRSRPSPSPP